MGSTSRFERYGEARALEVTDMLYGMFDMSDEEKAEADKLFPDVTEADAVETTVATTIENAMAIGYLLGMSDGRKDALGLSGKRFATGSNVRTAIDTLEFIHEHENGTNRCAADAFIAGQIGKIANMPVGLSGDQLRELGSEVR